LTSCAKSCQGLAPSNPFCSEKFRAPTLIFTECVMAYITPPEIDALLKFLIEKFENFQFMDYEMFNGQDRFGKMMVKNFQERGCPLKVIFAVEDNRGLHFSRRWLGSRTGILTRGMIAQRSTICGRCTIASCRPRSARGLGFLG
jgi:hypothetical protein